MQSLVPAIYPILKDSYGLTFAQVGLITLAFQFTASLLQPVVGFVTDKRPQPFSLAFGMGFTLIGLFLMSNAGSFPTILFSAALIGIGSAMGLVGLLGITWLSGTGLWPTIGDIVWNTANSFTLVAVPLFVLMGEIILRSGVSKRFYSGLSRLLFGVHGGLAQSNIVGCAVFAAICGVAAVALWKSNL